MSHHKLDCFGATDVGLIRSSNQDQFLIADLVKAVRIQSTSLGHDDHTEVAGSSHGKVFLVADGMGGHLAGNRASALAVDEMINFMVNRMAWHSFEEASEITPDINVLNEDLSRAVQHCQNKIQNEATLNPAKSGMGTTLTVAMMIWPKLVVVHAGDSRCYLFRKGQLEQVTQDHTLAEAYVQAGHMSPKEAEDSALSDQLWNVVGGSDHDIDPALYTTELALGDTLLLCTDGLNKHVSEDSIRKQLATDADAQQLCEGLIQQAREGGGSDNITVVVARMLDEEQYLKVAAAEMELSSSPDEPVTPPDHKSAEKANETTSVANRLENSSPKTGMSSRA